MIIDVTEKKPGHWLVKTEITIDIENEDKPALIAEMLAMYIYLIHEKVLTCAKL